MPDFLLKRRETLSACTGRVSASAWEFTWGRRQIGRLSGPWMAVVSTLRNNTVRFLNSRLIDLRVALSLLTGIALVSCAHQPVWNCPGITSPDQQLRACVLSVGKNAPPFNESRIEIHDANNRVLAFKDFQSPDGEHGRNVQKNEWTPDSQFFVFSTASSGGHSPWHWQTYFYDRRQNGFQELDDFTGPIIARDFTLSPPDWIEVTVQGTKSDPTDIQTGHKVKRRLSDLR